MTFAPMYDSLNAVILSSKAPDVSVFALVTDKLFLEL